MNLTHCQKKDEGVKCFDCTDRETCVQLNPPKPRLLLEPFTAKEKQEIPFIPYEHLDQYMVRMLMLISEDFLLTRSEKQELMVLASQFKPYAGKGGRGCSKERTFACLCLHLLERDGRGGVFEKNKEWYTQRYRLDLRNTVRIKEFVEKEIRRIMRK